MTKVHKLLADYRCDVQDDCDVLIIYWDNKTGVVQSNMLLVLWRFPVVADTNFSLEDECLSDQ